MRSERGRAACAHRVVLRAPLRARTSARLTRASHAPHTPCEQVAGGDDYGTQADVWSLGIVLYELFHGEMLSCHKDKRVSWLETPTTLA